MAGFLRVVCGLALLPFCWGLVRTFVDAVVVAAGRTGGISVEAVGLLAGMLAFVVVWLVLPHPVRAYVFGHELTHALWGICFGARPSDFSVRASGGSVRLTKSNVLITLAPYFFPFYTFVVVIGALVTSAFLQPLPCLPLWMFLIGFTWAFHVLFTLETLTRRQPDVTTYGRVFSWAFIFSANVVTVLVWMAATTPLTFAELGGFLLHRVAGAYVGVATGAVDLFKWMGGLCSRT